MENVSKCPKCGNTTFEVRSEQIVKDFQLDIIIIKCSKCDTAISAETTVLHEKLKSVEKKLDELLKKS